MALAATIIGDGARLGDGDKLLVVLVGVDGIGVGVVGLLRDVGAVVLLVGVAGGVVLLVGIVPVVVDAARRASARGSSALISVLRLP